jgi:hypothetical protein
MAINKLESGTYTRFKTTDGVMLEVFKVTETTAAETEPLETGKYYWSYENPDAINDPVGPFDTEEAALKDSNG